jgi:hypothetical protein
MTYYPLSGYKIDNFDLYGTWQIGVEKITGLYQLLRRKGDLSFSYPDSDGEEAYHTASDIYFEGNDVIMFCYLKSTSFSTLKTLLSSFRARLEKSGMKTLTVPYDTDTFSLMYIKGSDIEMLTPKRKSSYYIGKFWIQFRQTTPVRGS